MVDLGEAKPSLLLAFLSSPDFSAFKFVPDFLRGPKLVEEVPSLRSAPDPSRDSPGRLVRSSCMEWVDISGDTPRW